jgi:hypothetical protein
MDAELRSWGTSTTLIPLKLASRLLFLDKIKFIVIFLKLILSEHSLRSKLIVFWVMTACNVADNNQRFGGICCVRLYSSSLKVEATLFSQMLPDRSRHDFPTSPAPVILPHFIWRCITTAVDNNIRNLFKWYTRWCYKLCWINIVHCSINAQAGSVLPIDNKLSACS